MGIRFHSLALAGVICLLGSYSLAAQDPPVVPGDWVLAGEYGGRIGNLAVSPTGSGQVIVSMSEGGGHWPSDTVVQAPPLRLMVPLACCTQGHGDGGPVPLSRGFLTRSSRSQGAIVVAA